ncbi:MAG: hypothetical protein C3F13_02735 [Anaerolineales bacterium]|nr:MAG: hypothetical protein C3F13_02735 [Anaerolineales bacterium]
MKRLIGFLFLTLYLITATLLSIWWFRGFSSPSVNFLTKTLRIVVFIIGQYYVLIFFLNYYVNVLDDFHPTKDTFQNFVDRLRDIPRKIILGWKSWLIGILILLLIVIYMMYEIERGKYSYYQHIFATQTVDAHIETLNSNETEAFIEDKTRNCISADDAYRNVGLFTCIYGTITKMEIDINSIPSPTYKGYFCLDGRDFGLEYDKKCLELFGDIYLGFYINRCVLVVGKIEGGGLLNPYIYSSKDEQYLGDFYIEILPESSCK